MAPIYHTTTQLLSLVSSLNCPFTYNTFKRNTTEDGLDMVAVTLNATSRRSRRRPTSCA